MGLGFDACAAEDKGFGGLIRVGCVMVEDFGRRRVRVVPVMDVKSPHGLYHLVPGMGSFHLPARVRGMPERRVTLLSCFPFSPGTEPGGHTLFEQ